MRIIVGSRNRKKVAEIEAILSDFGVEAAPLPADAPDVEEDGATFHDNACKKASTLAAFLGEAVLSDDSGLEVSALDGRPGVHSARFAGEHGNDAKNIKKLLEMMADIDDRRAAFRCVIVLAGPGKPGTCTRYVSPVLLMAEGSCTGAIAREPRGSAGFGYDPIFVPDGREETFAELPAEIKNDMSHRGEALRNLKDKLSQLPFCKGG